MALMVAIECDAAWAEMVSDRLWLLGAMAIEEIPSAKGRVRLRTSLGSDGELVLSELASALGDIEPLTELHIVFDQVDDAVADTWRAFARPVRIDPDLVIVPAWLASDLGLTETMDSTKVRRRIVIEPGSTFGLGDHPTTQASLALLQRIGLGDRTILDVGCGSGILGITALCCGARSAMGVDINPASQEVSLDNAERNGVAQGWSVLVSDLDGTLVDTLLDRCPSGFDVITANILAPVLISMAPSFRRLLHREGTLIVSGILNTGHDHVGSALSPLVQVDRIDRQGWSALAFRHETSASISSR